MRRRAAKDRKIFPDAKYGEVIVSRLVNRLMNDGKKSVVEKAIYEAFDNLENKLKRSPIEIFKEALENITPKIEVRSRRIGGATYQIPVEVSVRRGSALALKWLKTSIENLKGMKISEQIDVIKKFLDKFKEDPIIAISIIESMKVDKDIELDEQTLLLLELSVRKKIINDTRNKAGRILNNESIERVSSCDGQSDLFTF